MAQPSSGNAISLPALSCKRWLLYYSTLYWRAIFMRYFFTICFLFNLNTLSGQGNSKAIPSQSDTCLKIANEIPLNSVAGTRHSKPLYIANGIVVSGEQLDVDLFENITISKCPEAFYKYYYAGINGAIIIETKQKFETVTPASIGEKKLIRGKVIYTLNGYYITDSTLQIWDKAIKSIDILAAKGAGISSTVINIWTFNKKELQSMKKRTSELCRGVIFTNLKSD